MTWLAFLKETNGTYIADPAVSTIQHNSIRRCSETNHTILTSYIHGDSFSEVGLSAHSRGHISQRSCWRKVTHLLCLSNLAIRRYYFMSPEARPQFSNNPPFLINIPALD